MSDKVKNEIFEWTKSIIVALVLAAVIFVLARPSFIVGSSMENTFWEGDVVLVERASLLFSAPAKGEIIVAQSHLKLDDNHDKIIIKRVIGVPGDHVVISDGMVYLNGIRLSESYIKDGITNGEVDLVVPEKHFFVMGDNRLGSNDSRSESIGLIKLEEIKGKVWIRIWPFKSIRMF